MSFASVSTTSSSSISSRILPAIVPSTSLENSRSVRVDEAYVNVSTPSPRRATAVEDDRSRGNNDPQATRPEIPPPTTLDLEDGAEENQGRGRKLQLVLSYSVLFITFGWVFAFLFTYKSPIWQKLRSDDLPSLVSDLIPLDVESRFAEYILNFATLYLPAAVVSLCSIWQISVLGEASLRTQTQRIQ